MSCFRGVVGPPLTGSGNGLRPAFLGAVLLAILTLFAFLNGVPWERRGAVAEVKADLQRELADIRTDLREIRDTLRGWAR